MYPTTAKAAGIEKLASELFTALYGPSRDPASAEYKDALGRMRDVDDKYPPGSYDPLEIEEYALKIDLDSIQYLLIGLPGYQRAPWRQILYGFFEPAAVDQESRLEISVRLESLGHQKKAELQSVQQERRVQKELADCLKILAPVTQLPSSATSWSMLTSAIAATSTAATYIATATSRSNVSDVSTSPAEHLIKTIVNGALIKNRIKSAIGPGPSYAEIQGYKRREADRLREE